MSMDILSAYYIDDENTPHAIKNCIKLFKENFFDLFTTYGADVWIAGGALRSYFLDETPRDIDVYSRNEDARQKFISWMNGKGAIAIDDSPLSSVYMIDGVTYDVIKKHYDSPEETLRSFDLGPTLCATDGIALYCDPNYFINLSTKTLTVNNVTDGNDTLMRMFRYANKGFVVPQAELDKVKEHLSIYENREEIKDVQNTTSNSVNSSRYKEKPVWGRIFKEMKGVATKTRI